MVDLKIEQTLNKNLFKSSKTFKKMFYETIEIHVCRYSKENLNYFVFWKKWGNVRAYLFGPHRIAYKPKIII